MVKIFGRKISFRRKPKPKPERIVRAPLPSTTVERKPERIVRAPLPSATVERKPERIVRAPLPPTTLKRPSPAPSPKPTPTKLIKLLKPSVKTPAQLRKLSTIEIAKRIREQRGVSAVSSRLRQQRKNLFEEAERRKIQFREKVFIPTKVKAKEIKEKISKKKKEVTRKRILRGLKRQGLEPTKENISIAESLLKKREKQASREVEFLLLGAGFSPAGKGATLLKPKVVEPKIKFIGKQRTIGNKIFTDIAFIQDKTRIGIARGVTAVKGKRGFTITAGKSGKIGVQFPSGKIAIKNVRSFVAREVGISKPSKFIIKTKVDLLRKSRKVGKLNVIRKNIEGLEQIGVGQIATVKGDKFIRTIVKFPSGKLKKVKVKNIRKDTFVSLSSVFTKGDLSKIIGRTITSEGNRVKFIGIIRGERGAKGLSLSSGEKLQFRKALNKVIGASASSVAEAKKIKGLSQIKRIATISSLITAKKVSRIKVEPIAQIRRVIRGKSVSLTQAKKLQKRIGVKIKQRTKGIQSLRQRIKQKETQKTRQRLQQILKQQTAQTQKLKQTQKLIKKQIKKVKTAKGLRVRVPRIPRIPKGLVVPKIIPRVKKGIITKKKPVKKKAFIVFARPLKKKGQKKRPKLVRISKKPLSRPNAKRLGSTIVDTTLSRTFKLKPIKKKPSRPVLRTSRYKPKKFRTFRIVKGKRKPLKDTFIERKGKALIDTRGEKRGLTLRKGLKQLRKRSTKPVRVKRVTKPTRVKRTLSEAQLKALAKGRKILKEKRKGGKK